MPLGHEEKYNESCTGGAKVPEATVIEVDLEVMLAVKVSLALSLTLSWKLQKYCGHFFSDFVQFESNT